MVPIFRNTCIKQKVNLAFCTTSDLIASLIAGGGGQSPSLHFVENDNVLVNLTHNYVTDRPLAPYAESFSSDSPPDISDEETNEQIEINIDVNRNTNEQLDEVIVDSQPEASEVIHNTSFI